MAQGGGYQYRLCAADKPLTVRLFPCPGLAAGDIAAFASEDLVDCAVFAVPGRRALTY